LGNGAPYPASGFGRRRRKHSFTNLRKQAPKGEIHNYCLASRFEQTQKGAGNP